jgi:hypothetical protein
VEFFLPGSTNPFIVNKFSFYLLFINIFLLYPFLQQRMSSSINPTNNEELEVNRLTMVFNCYNRVGTTTNPNVADGISKMFTFYFIFFSFFSFFCYGFSILFFYFLLNLFFFCYWLSVFNFSFFFYFFSKFRFTTLVARFSFCFFFFLILFINFIY